MSMLPIADQRFPLIARIGCFEPPQRDSGLRDVANLPSTHATKLRTNSGSSCRWLRMIPSLGTKATIFCDVLRHCTMRLRFGSAMSLDN